MFDAWKEVETKLYIIPNWWNCSWWCIQWYKYKRYKNKNKKHPNISWPKRRLDLQYLHILVNFKALRVSSNIADVSLASTTGRGNRVKSPTGLWSKMLIRPKKMEQQHEWTHMYIEYIYEYICSKNIWKHTISHVQEKNTHTHARLKSRKVPQSSYHNLEVLNSGFGWEILKGIPKHPLFFYKTWEIGW